jgi:hypothetical protein
MEDSGHQGPEENKLMMRSSVIVDRVDILSLSEGSDNEQAVARLSQIVTEAASELENSSKSHHEEIMAQKVSNYRRFKRNPASVEVKEENKTDEEALSESGSSQSDLSDSSYNSLDFYCPEEESQPVKQRPLFQSYSAGVGQAFLQNLLKPKSKS